MAFATFYVDRLVVGPTVAVVQTRDAGGLWSGYWSRTAGEPELDGGASYLLVFRSRQQPLPSLFAGTAAPVEAELPADEQLHASWDAMCATGPAYGAWLDTDGAFVTSR